MNSALDRESLSVQITRRFSAELHRVLAESNLTLGELAAKVGESEVFLRRLMAEDDVASVIKLELLADIVWATGRPISMELKPRGPAKNPAKAAQPLVRLRK